MNDIFEKTPEYIIPQKKFNHLLNPKTDIFNREPIEEYKSSLKRTVSIEDIRNDGDYLGKRNREMNEIHFKNIYKDK